MNKDGTPQPLYTWQTITIATGEDALTSDSTRGGVISRVVELFTQPISDEDLASTMHSRVEEAFGVAGPEFVRRILVEDYNVLKDQLEMIKQALNGFCPQNIYSHVASVSIVVFADYYMHRYFFETSNLDDSIDLGKKILGMLQDKADVDDAKRAYEEVMSWCEANYNSFGLDAKERTGWYKEDYVYIYPTVFRKILHELGFNDKRIKQEWASRKWMLTDARDDKVRLTTRVLCTATGKRTAMIGIKLEL